MTKLYKLTDENGYTRADERNACKWGKGVTHSGTGNGELCGPGYIHAYTHPLLAVFLNPMHAAFRKPRIWEADGEIALRDGELKVGCVSLTTVRELSLPEVSTEQRIKFAILCALKVYNEPGFVTWAEGWLTGKDRSREAADAAARAARAAYAAGAAYAAVARAADAADAAARAADAAARAAYAAGAAGAAYAAAYAAARAAGAAARDGKLAEFAEQVVQILIGMKVPAVEFLPPLQ